jgi:hypothetical protein
MRLSGAINWKTPLVLGAITINDMEWRHKSENATYAVKHDLEWNGVAP